MGHAREREALAVSSGEWHGGGLIAALPLRVSFIDEAERKFEL